MSGGGTPGRQGGGPGGRHALEPAPTAPQPQGPRGRRAPGRGDSVCQAWRRQPKVERACHLSTRLYPAGSRAVPRTATGSQGLRPAPKDTHSPTGVQTEGGHDPLFRRAVDTIAFVQVTQDPRLLAALGEDSAFQNILSA